MMSKLIWHETDCCAAERGDWCAWIEPLDLEDEGRFVWSVDILDPSGASVPFNVVAGIEPSLAAAKLAAEEAVAHLPSPVTDYSMLPIGRRVQNTRRKKPQSRSSRARR